MVVLVMVVVVVDACISFLGFGGGVTKLSLIVAYSALHKCRESLALIFFCCCGEGMLVEVDNCQLPAK